MCDLTSTNIGDGEDNWSFWKISSGDIDSFLPCVGLNINKIFGTKEGDIEYALYCSGWLGIFSGSE